MIKPMLAHRYRDHHKSITYPVAVQPKLNGIRALYSAGRFWSRDQIQFNPEVVEHIAQRLSSRINPNIILDGEFYHHGWSLQKINGAIAVKRLKPNKFTLGIEYHIFDIAHQAPFEDRSHLLSLLDNIPYINVVPTYICETPAVADTYFSQFKRSGYEGIMYRDLSSPYGMPHLCGNKENRWKHLIKRKDHISQEFTVTGYEQEVSKDNMPKPQVGSFQFQTQQGAYFNAGSGLDQRQKQHFWNTESPIGRVCTLNFEMFSDSGIPLKPIIALVHDR